jgi:hypothetical protein
MKITVIAAFSHPEYKEKTGKSNTRSNIFWQCAPWQNGEPLDIVDFYLDKTGKKPKYPRHIYNNGIVIFNYFREAGHDVHLINTLSEITSYDENKLTEAEAVIISTGYPGYGKRLHNILSVTRRIRKTTLKQLLPWAVGKYIDYP